VILQLKIQLLIIYALPYDFTIPYDFIVNVAQVNNLCFLCQQDRAMGVLNYGDAKSRFVH